MYAVHIEGYKLDIMTLKEACGKIRDYFILLVVAWFGVAAKVDLEKKNYSLLNGVGEVSRPCWQEKSTQQADAAQDYGVSWNLVSYPFAAGKCF